ncbi:MAG: Wzz/FepE/Etk N-terminal domain-containing protein [Pseudomonadota bacterium]
MSNLRTNRQSETDDDINIVELLTAVWKGKLSVAIACFIAGIVGIAYSLSIPNEYRSEVLLAPAEEANGGGLSALAGQFGGLASLAGVDLAGGKSDKTTMALELLKSKSFIGEFVDKRNLKPLIMASNGWSRNGNEVKFDDDIYDATSNSWVREVSSPLKAEPSLLEVHKKFVEDHLSVSKDKETGFVKIAVIHHSPFVARDITTNLIIDINDRMRALDIAEAEKSIGYLTDALEKTAVADMQKIFYQLIEKQQQTKMLANVREEYVFKVIDPAVVPEKKSGPKRALICLLLVTSAFLISCLVLIVRDQVKKSRV